MTLGRRGELLRRFRYARAELTPGFERRQARRAAYDDRYGPCVGDVEDVACPLHGWHETSSDEPVPVSRGEHLANVVPLVLMIVVVVVCAVVNASYWVGLPLAVLSGPVLRWVWLKTLDRGQP